MLIKHTTNSQKQITMLADSKKEYENETF